MYKYKWQNWLIVMIFNSSKTKTIRTVLQERRIKKQDKKERCGICVGGGKKGKKKGISEEENVPTRRKTCEDVMQKSKHFHQCTLCRHEPP